LKNTVLLSLFLVLVNIALLAQTNPVPLTYQPLSPVSVNPGHPGFTLRVHGTGFRAGAVVKWNRQSLKTTFLSSSALRANVPATAVAKPGTASVTVVNPGTIASNVIYLPVRSPSSTVTVETDPAAIETGEAVVGDFNNDNKVDIAVAYLDPNDILSPDLYLGGGNGKFTRVQGIASNAIMLTGGSIAADFNNDGKLDAAICTSTGSDDESCAIFLGDGKGGLAAINSRYFGPGVAADVNGDGNLDVVAAFTDGSVYQLFTYLGNGDGTFRLLLESAINLNSYLSGIPVIGDFNRDGRLDVAVPGGQYDFVAVLLGNGDGTFQSEVDYPILQDGRASGGADINGDGKLDILTSCINGTVAVLLGQGDGTFVSGGSPALHLGGLQIAELNGDGKLDLATVSADNAGNLTLHIALGNGGGTFQPPLALSGGQYPFPSGWMSLADFNNDGRLDVAISGSLNQTIPSPSIVLVQTPAK
jgi:hypothetical protein